MSSCSRGCLCTPGEGTKCRGNAAQEASEEDKHERASSACRYAGGPKAAARTLLADSRSADNEETWTTLLAEFPPDDRAAVSAPAATILASGTEGEEGSAPAWLPNVEFDSHVHFDIISSRSVLLAPGKDGQRFAHL